MNTYEACFKNSIGGYIDFDVEAETEEEAKQKAFNEMEAEGFVMDSSLSDGYYLHSLEEVKKNFTVLVEKLMVATASINISAKDEDEANRIAKELMYEIPKDEWDQDSKGQFHVLSVEEE